MTRNAMVMTVGVVLAAGLLVLVALPILVPGTCTTRPLGQDEMVTIGSRSSVPYGATMEELRAESRLAPARIPRGWARNFATPWDPNNHMVNSLLIPVSFAFFGYGEIQARLPAVLGLCILVGLFFLWSREKVGPWVAAGLSIALAVHPYVSHVGTTARGYSPGLALLLAQLIVCERMREGNWRFHLGRGILSFAVFLNLVSMLTSWLIPLYGLLWLRVLYRNRDKIRKYRWDVVRSLRLEGLLAESCGLAVAIAMFLAFNLGPIHKSLGKYGIRLTGATDLAHQVAATTNSLFPGLWLLLLCAILVLLPFGRKKEGVIPVSLLAAGSAIAICAFALVTGKFAYARTHGHFVLLTFVLLSFCLAGIKQKKTQLMSIAVTAILSIAGTVLMFRQVPLQPGLGEEALRISAAMEKNQQPVVIVEPWVYRDVTSAYLPKRHGRDPEVLQSVQLALIAFAESGGDKLRTQYANRRKQEMQYWSIPNAWAKGRLGQTRGVSSYILPARALGLDSYPGPSVVIWTSHAPYFRFGNYISDRLKTEGSPWDIGVVTHGKQLFIFIANQEEWAKARAIDRELRAVCKGRGIAVTPVTPQ